MSMYAAPHRRYNPLTDEWVLVSPHRAKRPWQGQEEELAPEEQPSYDPHCYLCPGNRRAGGVQNPQYEHTFVFVNDFSALLADTPAAAEEDDPLFRAHSERGICKVVCFSPRHDLTLSRMESPAIRRVIDVWDREYRLLGEEEYINYVQIFENRGSAMGCSNPHPHGQIWANETIPDIPSREELNQRAYLEKHGSCLLCDYLRREEELQERVILSGEHFVALVPYWAVWPFETLVLPRRHVASVSDLRPAERDDLAELMRRLGTRYDNLFRTHFPYSMGLHQQPTDNREHPGWHFHLHYYPPLLRSATVRKFMVGYEMLANPQRDITAETAAQRLRELSDTHFLRQRREDG
jgi:UDPglucose--hexose-1-phosphate uridylyltransferase